MAGLWELSWIDKWSRKYLKFTLLERWLSEIQNQSKKKSLNHLEARWLGSPSCYTCCPEQLGNGLDLLWLSSQRGWPLKLPWDLIAFELAHSHYFPWVHERPLVKRLNVTKKLRLKMSIFKNSLVHIWSKPNKPMKNHSNLFLKGKSVCLAIILIHLVMMNHWDLLDHNHRFKQVQVASRLKLQNLKASLILKTSWIGYTRLKQFLSTKTSPKTRRWSWLP